MGLGSHAIDAIGREHAFRPIRGDVLFIGRQATYLTADQLAAHLRSHGNAVDPSAIEIDRTTINRLTGYADNLVTDRSIFRALGVDSVKALDISPYEGAEVVHDLGQPLPDRLKATADFIVDGSTLDNVFDPAMALRNFAQLLRPGGRLIAINCLNMRDGAYTICPPDWFLDYFVENGFADCKVYVCAGVRNSTNSYWFDTQAMVAQKPDRPYLFPALWWRYFTMVFAEKASASTTDLVPQQLHYRSAEAWARYAAQLSDMNCSERPHLARSVGTLYPRLSRRGFRWMDSSFQPRVLKPSLPRRIIRTWLRRRNQPSQ